MIEKSIELKKPIVAEVYLTPGFRGDMLQSIIDHAENVVVVMYDESIDMSKEVASIIETSTIPIFIAKNEHEHDAMKRCIKEVFNEGKRGKDLYVEVRELMKAYA